MKFQSKQVKLTDGRVFNFDFVLGDEITGFVCYKGSFIHQFSNEREFINMYAGEIGE